MKKYLIPFLRFLVALILLQTLYFKFTAAPESVYIFETVGLEPAGRYLSGVFELIAAVLLLIPGIFWLGAALSIGIISGALFFHLTLLGIEVKDDGGLLFVLALVVFFSSAIILYSERHKIFLYVKNILSVDS